MLSLVGSKFLPVSIIWGTFLTPPTPSKPPTANNHWPDSCPLQIALSVLTSPPVGSYIMCWNPYVHFCFFFHALRLFHVWLTLLKLTQGWVVINKCILPFFFFKNFIYHILINTPRSTPLPHLPNFVSSKSINCKWCCSFIGGGASHSSIPPEGTPLKKREGWENYVTMLWSQKRNGIFLKWGFPKELWWYGFFF